VDLVLVPSGGQIVVSRIGVHSPLARSVPGAAAFGGYGVVEFVGRWPDSLVTEQLAEHELGHAVGLGESPDPRDVMFDFWDGWAKWRGSLLALQELYGAAP
jgi:hypothetical protein